MTIANSVTTRMTKPRSDATPWWIDLVRGFTQNVGAVISFCFLGLVAVVAALAPSLAPYDPIEISRQSLVPPGPGHLMGTDNLGRDIFSGVIHGARISLGVGILAAATAGIIGILVGGVSGFAGGRTDSLLMRVTEVFQILPQFFLAVLIIALMGGGIEKIIAVIGLLSWPPIARLVRVACIEVKTGEFVEAARTIGASSSRILFRHVLPNAIAPAIVAISLTVGRAILTEANLGFFGLSDPSLVSWGRMLNNAQKFLHSAWWLALFPGLAILLTVLSVNILGDGLNDALNPKLRRR